MAGSRYERLVGEPAHRPPAADRVAGRPEACFRSSFRRKPPPLQYPPSGGRLLCGFTRTTRLRRLSGNFPPRPSGQAAGHRPSGDLPGAAVCVQAALRPQARSDRRPPRRMPPPLATCSPDTPTAFARTSRTVSGLQGCRWQSGCPSFATDAITVPSFSTASSGLSRNSPATAKISTAAAGGNCGW